MITDKRMNPSKKLRDAVKWSKAQGSGDKPRTSMTGAYDSHFNQIATEERVICLDCEADLNAGVVRASDDRECICGTLLFTVRGEPTARARIKA